MKTMLQLLNYQHYQKMIGNKTAYSPLKYV